MSKFEKMINRILQLDKGIRYEELANALESIGYHPSKEVGSSHITFRKGNCMPITIPRHEPIKVVYIKTVRDALIKEGGY